MAELEKRLKKLLDKHALARIELIVTDHGYVARGFPAIYNPIVQARRDALIAEAGGSLTIGSSLSSAITNKSMGQLGFGRGKTLEEAVGALADELAKTKIAA